MCKYDGYEMKTLWIYESNDETTFGPVCGRDGANAVECSYWHLWQLPAIPWMLQLGGFALVAVSV